MALPKPKPKAKPTTKRAPRPGKRASRKTADAPAPKAKPPVETSVRPARGEVAKAMLRRFVDADLPSQAAALAFWAVLSLPPLLLLLLWMVNALVPQAQVALLGQIAQLAGEDARAVAQSLIDAAEGGPQAVSIGGWGSIVWLFVGATTVFAQLQDALNRIFRTDATHLPDLPTWLRKRIFTFGLVFAVGFLLMVSLTVTTAMQLLFGHVEWMLPVMKMLADWLVYALAFALTYHFLPDRRVHWRRSLAGGALTSALFLLGRALIGWYLDSANPTAGYGSVAALALSLLWIYYASLVVFIGALFTAVVDERERLGEK
jgi:membrane protein